MHPMVRRTCNRAVCFGHSRASEEPKESGSDNKGDPSYYIEEIYSEQLPYPSLENVGYGLVDLDNDGSWKLAVGLYLMPLPMGRIPGSKLATWMGILPTTLPSRQKLPTKFWRQTGSFILHRSMCPIRSIRLERSIRHSQHPRSAFTKELRSCRSVLAWTFAFLSRMS